MYGYESNVGGYLGQLFAALGGKEPGTEAAAERIGPPSPALLSEPVRTPPGTRRSGVERRESRDHGHEAAGQDGDTRRLDTELCK